ncbi:MAG: hypothetical protein AB7O21_07780 [Gammaproteobacteria bacterium]
MSLSIANASAARGLTVGGAPRHAGRHAPDAGARRPHARADTREQAVGYVGLQQALEGFPPFASARSAVLLTALIHSMGGAATSIARGAYVNTRI